MIPILQSIIQQKLQVHHAAIESVVRQLGALEQLADRMVRAFDKGGKVIWFGNGGSAADAQHLAAELMVRYKAERRPLASIALTTDTSLITAHANDYAFDSLFQRQVESIAKPEDVVIGISTSGNSPNVVLGLEQAQAMQCQCFAFTGRNGGKLVSMLTDYLCIEVDTTAQIQEAHIFAGHLLCEQIDAHYSQTD